MQDGLTAPVVGPSAILPRGFLWLAPIWYCAAALALAANHTLPAWLRLDAAGSLLAAVITFMLALSRLTVRGFTADREGVRLGLPPTSRRRGRRRRRARLLTWAEIERLRIARRPYGSRLEIVLSQHATAAVRPRRSASITTVTAWLIMLVIPLCYLWRPTGLTCPRDRPPRYRVALRDLTPEEARLALRALAPADVMVAVKTRKRRSVSSASSARTTQPQIQRT